MNLCFEYIYLYVNIHTYSVEILVSPCSDIIVYKVGQFFTNSAILVRTLAEGKL